MEENLRLINSLKSITPNTEQHGRWLNTLSFLEYIGFRKIVKSQPSERVNSTILRHAQEEGRHAILLKNLAIKIAGPEFDDYHPSHMIASQEASNYFQSLDHRCAEALEKHDPILNYYYVTWLVEVRALSVYSTYIDSLNQMQQQSQNHFAPSTTFKSTKENPVIFNIINSLNGLIKEETGHLSHVETQIKLLDSQHEKRQDMFQKLENTFFDEFVRGLEMELAKL